MARGLAHFVQVVVLAAGADDFLRRGGALVISLLGAEEDVFELVHSGVDKEQRRVVRREQGRRFDYLVSISGKVVQECGSYFVSGHNGLSPSISIGAIARRAIVHNVEKMKFSDGHRLCQTWPLTGAFALRPDIRKLITVN